MRMTECVKLAHMTLLELKTIQMVKGISKGRNTWYKGRVPMYKNIISRFGCP